MEVCMTEISVRECVRGCLEPYNDGVHLGKSADEWVVDVEVDDICRDGETEGDVHSMSPGHDDPG